MKLFISRSKVKMSDSRHIVLKPLKFESQLTGPHFGQDDCSQVEVLAIHAPQTNCTEHAGLLDVDKSQNYY